MSALVLSNDFNIWVNTDMLSATLTVTVLKHSVVD